MDTGLTLDFADGKYNFRLLIPQVLELERKTGKSVFVIYEEIYQGLGNIDGKPTFIGGGKAHLTDLLEVIRLGLIGGGDGIVLGETVAVSPIKAQQIVADYCFPNRPLAECLPVAWAILNAAIEGIQLKKRNQRKQSGAVQ